MGPGVFLKQNKKTKIFSFKLQKVLNQIMCESDLLLFLHKSLFNRLTPFPITVYVDFTYN